MVVYVSRTTERALPVKEPLAPMCSNRAIVQVLGKPIKINMEVHHKHFRSRGDDSERNLISYVPEAIRSCIAALAEPPAGLLRWDGQQAKFLGRLISHPPSDIGLITTSSSNSVQLS